MIRGTHRAAVLVCVVALCCWTSAAAAQLAALTWSAPRGCPDKSYVEQHLAALSPSETSRSDLRVRAQVQRSGRARYLLKLELRASAYRAERRLESTQCASVVDAAIWLIAMAFDPNLSAGAGSVATLPADTVEAPRTEAATPPATKPESSEAQRVLGQAGPLPSAPEPDTPSQSTSEQTSSGSAARVDPSRTSPAAALDAAHEVPAEMPRATAAPDATADRSPVLVSSAPRRAPWRGHWATQPRWWRAGLFAGVWSAGMPAPQASVGGRLGFGLSVLYAELRGALELSRGRRLADATEVHLATQDGGLALCSHWGARLRGGPCATVSVLRTTAGSRAAPVAYDRALLWGAAGASLELGFRLVGGLEIMFETGLQLPVSARPRFTVEGVGEVAVAAPLNVYARLGLGFRSTDVAREQ